ncbi:YraN family protein [Castellaniella sp.]|uniref:YraN family protein n=1 Tax=Castellaniella sp. TaxID=1955812 RepID=UPI002B0039D3|nr:YraN family protein [Castellaniella sp.]
MPMDFLTDAHGRAQIAQQLARKRRIRAIQAAARRQPLQAWRQPLTPGSPSQRQGHAAESRACNHLIQQGARILARNLHCKAGEIDVLAYLDGTLIFIEVRQRKHGRYGGAAASVNRTKQARLIRAARYFLPTICRHYFAGHEPPCRFDVISVQMDKIDWIADAFRL